MAKKEVKTDLWVYELLQEADIHLTPQGCDIKEIDEALKTASKSNTGNAGYPEYCGVVKDFILVIEDKASLDKHLYKDEKELIAQDVKAVRNYAVMVRCFMRDTWQQIQPTIKCLQSEYQEMKNVIELRLFS